MNSTLTFFIAGIPCPGGSKKFVGFSKKSGRAIIVDDAGQRNKDWRTLVGIQGRAAMIGTKPFTEPLEVNFRFFMQRPQFHFGIKQGMPHVKDSAPRHHTTKPDTTKLIRAVEDALTSICWTDDALIVRQSASKEFAKAGTTNAGCEVTIKFAESDDRIL